MELAGVPFGGANSGEFRNDGSLRGDEGPLDALWTWRDGVIELMQQCYDWFAASRLPQPALYVPPAWAMGAIGRTRLAADGPFRLYELFGGVFDAGAREYVQRLGRVLRKRGNAQAVLYEVIARKTVDEGIARRRRPKT